MTSCMRRRGNTCCRFHRFILRFPLQLSIANLFGPLYQPAFAGPHPDGAGRPRGRNASALRSQSRAPQDTLTVTALLVLPWNWEEPRYWALNVKLPGPKNATVK